MRVVTSLVLGPGRTERDKPSHGDWETVLAGTYTHQSGPSRRRH
jgi:hypothetical protein